ncbi:MAG: hypothetical protein Kow0068_10180 [Marinilabiliales bacterium]
MKTFDKHLLKQNSTIREALTRLDMLAADAILFIVDDNNKLIGSLTDGDVRRGLLKGFSLDNNVDDIKHPNPKFIRKGERNINKVIEYREKNYRIIPILNKEDQIVNVINFRELKSYLPIDAVIMAGGRGERLKPLTDDTPKPLLKIGDKTIIEYNIDRLRLFGVDDFWITLNYLGEQIESHLGSGKDKNIKINYIYEKQALGTLGAVSLINNFEHDYILVSNADLLTNIDYEHFFLDFLKNNADFSVVTIPYKINIPYAVLETSNGIITDFKEKPTYTYYSNGGIYLMKKEALKFIPKETPYNATELMKRLMNESKKVISYPFQGYWLDVGKHSDLEQAKKDIEHINWD